MKHKNETKYHRTITNDINDYNAVLSFLQNKPTWFGLIGGGIQYQLGTPLDLLISEGIIKIFGGL